MKVNLKNKTYVISAGADGIGFAIAKKIISVGGKVYISDINKKKINEINKKYKSHQYLFEVFAIVLKFLLEQFDPMLK